MKGKKAALAALVLTLVFVTSGLLVPAPPKERAIVEQPAHTETVTYPNTDNAVLWVRRNGSDPGFPFSGANVAPTFGMQYFGTQTVQIVGVSDYNYSTLNDPAVFPLGTKEYIGCQGSVIEAAGIADQALTNPRIMGTFWDDFPGNLQSPANMSALYAAIHHEDANLSRSLTLGVIVYSGGYFGRTPYSWSSIANYFDIIQFWYYPDNFGLVWANFAGYETALRDFHAMLPTKEIWGGVYLHFYNAGPEDNSYPTSLTYQQLGSWGGACAKEL